MQTEEDWKDEIEKITKNSIKRNRDILKNLEEQNNDGAAENSD